MARGARNVGVSVSQRKAECVVIKFSVRPLGDGVALRASRGVIREAYGDVIGDAGSKRRSLIPIGNVAAIAVGGIQRVVVADVARRARRGRWRHVRADKSEAGSTVIERRAIPTLGGMAGGAIRDGECGTRGRVNRRGGLLPLGEMAPGISAIGWRDLQIVIVVDVAGRAGNVGVAVGERKTGCGVIERCIVPTQRGVAGGAVCYGEGRAGFGVNRIVGGLPGGEMAAGIAAIRGSDFQIVVVVDVARSARHVGVAIGQQEASGAVIKFRASPSVERMAGFAGGGEISADVIGVDGFLEVRQMARRASGRQALELTDRGALVALLALDDSVRAEKREPILMVLDLSDRNLPTEDGVALRAIGTKFSAVNIRVAISAILAHIGENGIDVALNAFHFFVHAPQGIVGAVMIELQHGTNGAPGSGCVAIFARNCERTVRTFAVGLLSERILDERKQPNNEQQPGADLDTLQRVSPLRRPYR